MRTVPFFKMSLVSVFFTFCCASVDATRTVGHQQLLGHLGVAIVKAAPSVHASTYKCGKMVWVVNYLRRLGKEKSLTALRKYLASGGEHNKVIVICRLLFANPKGWATPKLGQPVPEINASGVRQMPMFPLALSNRVPFLLVEGYDIIGVPESALLSLQLCEGLALVTEDYPITGHEKAARDLVNKASFLQLYEPQQRREMAEIILRQAKPATERRIR
jgi:hypothetical protein